MACAGHVWRHSHPLWSLTIWIVVVGTSLLGSPLVSSSWAENLRADAPSARPSPSTQQESPRRGADFLKVQGTTEPEQWPRQAPNPRSPCLSLGGFGEVPSPELSFHIWDNGIAITTS